MLAVGFQDGTFLRSAAADDPAVAVRRFAGFLYRRFRCRLSLVRFSFVHIDQPIVERKSVVKRVDEVPSADHFSLVRNDGGVLADD